MLDQVMQDFSYGVRGLRRAPGFAALAILTLALGIGANTAIFSIIYAVLLRPLPYDKPGQLVRLYETEAAPGNYPFTGPDFLDWKTQNHSFQDMTLISWAHSMNLSGQGEPDHVMGIPTESNFFSLLGARPLLGRAWAQGEDEPAHDHVLILSYGLWQSHFGGDPKIIGRDVELNGEKYNVIGVMPAGFHFPAEAQLWVPLNMDSKGLGPRGSHSFRAFGRLKPGVSLQQAQSEMSVIAGRLEQQYPDSNYKVGASLVQLHEDMVGESRSSLLMMLWAVALVLLIACANIANLLLSRAVARQKEMAIRGALGAGRTRLIRQVLTESVLLSGTGAVAGLALAWGGVKVITSLKHLGLPEANAININPAVLGFTLVLAFLTGVVFGIVPALQISRPDFFEELKGGAGSAISAGRKRRSVSDALVIGEVALSLLLLISAGLLLRDFIRLRSNNIGVRPEGVWTAVVSLPDAKYKDPQPLFSFAESLLEKVGHIPGVESAALSNRMPLEGGSNGYISLRGQPFKPMSGPLVESHAVSPDYFKAMGIPLLQGRVFTQEDVNTALALDKRVDAINKSGGKLSPQEKNAITIPTVVNQAMVRQFWPNQNPIGQMFTRGDKDGPWYEVIGVTGDVKQWGITHASVPEAYDAFDGSQYMYVVVHTSTASMDVTSEVRHALTQVDAGLPLFGVRTMDQVIAEHASGQQFLALLVGLFSGLALILAAVGIYGVLSYLVTQRTREIGIRMSLGASRSNVLTLVLRHGMRLAGLGFALGLIAALAAGRLLSGLLHEIHPGDPATIALTALSLALVALLACYVPARRAAKVDPMVALRHE
ncbi:MAG TPA: ABC transporter permease [Terriglobales bacterium]|nr:ABC transporter permease [Terriglobales bacterium]